MEISVAQIKAKFSEIASYADAGEDVIITNRGKPVYRLTPIVTTIVKKRPPFPDLTPIAKQSKPYIATEEGGCFVADWRQSMERPFERLEIKA